MSIPGLRSFQPPSQAARAVSGNLQSLQGQGYCFIDVVSGWSNTTDGNRTLIISGVSVQHLVLLGLDWSYGGFTSNQQGRQHSLQQDSNGKIVLVLHPSTSACSLKELLPLLLGCVPENFGPRSALDAITFLQVYCPGTLELPSPYHQFMMHHLTAQLLNSTLDASCIPQLSSLADALRATSACLGSVARAVQGAFSRSVQAAQPQDLISLLQGMHASMIRSGQPQAASAQAAVPTQALGIVGSVAYGSVCPSMQPIAASTMMQDGCQAGGQQAHESLSSLEQAVMDTVFPRLQACSMVDQQGSCAWSAEAVQLCVELLRVLVAGICVATPSMITTSLPQQQSETWPQEESEDGLSSESESDSGSDDVVVDMRKVLQMCDELAALMKERHMVQQAVGAAAAGHTGLTAAADTVTAIPGALGPQAAGATSASAAMAGETATACANGTSIKGAAVGQQSMTTSVLQQPLLTSHLSGPHQMMAPQLSARSQALSERLMQLLHMLAHLRPWGIQAQHGHILLGEVLYASAHLHTHLGPAWGIQSKPYSVRSVPGAPGASAPITQHALHVLSSCVQQLPQPADVFLSMGSGRGLLQTIAEYPQQGCSLLTAVPALQYWLVKQFSALRLTWDGDEGTSGRRVHCYVAFKAAAQALKALRPQAKIAEELRSALVIVLNRMEVRLHDPRNQLTARVIVAIQKACFSHPKQKLAEGLVHALAKRGTNASTPHALGMGCDTCGALWTVEGKPSKLRRVRRAYHMCPIQYASCATHDVLAYVDSFDPARDAPLRCISAKPAVQRWIAAKMVKSTSLRLCRSLQYRCSGACGWGSRLDVCFTNYAKKQMLADGCRTACLLCGEDMVASKDYF